MAQTTVAQKAAFGSSHVAPRICLRPRQAKIFVKTPSQRQIFFQSSSRQANKIAALLDINEADFETQVLKVLLHTIFIVLWSHFDFYPPFSWHFVNLSIKSHGIIIIAV